MYDIALTGCAPEPLMNYLKALGIFRLVAEQADPTVRLAWYGGMGHLMGSFDSIRLESFLLDEYRPTPLVAPWNGGSGFYGRGSDVVKRIAASTNSRFQHYRTTIQRIQEFKPVKKPEKNEKNLLLAECRSKLDDHIVPWLDSCFALGESSASYFPLLGSGANDGNFEFTLNFMQRLLDVISTDRNEPSQDAELVRNWLQAALYARGPVELSESVVGQFNPGGAGGANASQGFSAKFKVNPWDFVLMLEGVLLFAGSVSRRLGTTASGRAVFPFTVDTVAAGYGSATAADEDSSRGELWLPLWNEPASLPEVSRFFAEGRAQLGRRQANNAVEFLLAVNLLGINRGVSAFTRYAFLKRNGLNFFATPLGRVQVTLRPDSRLLDDPALRGWMQRLRGACRDKERTPMRYSSALRRIDSAIFEFGTRSEHGNDRKYLLNVLAALGDAEKRLALEGVTWSREKLRPLQDLSARWLDEVDDGTAEFRLAAGLAGISRTLNNEVGPLRVFLERVELSGGRFQWASDSTSAVWSKRTLAENLARIVTRRMMEAFRNNIAGIPVYSCRPVQLGDIFAFLNFEVNENKVESLLWGLSCIDWAGIAFRQPERDEVSLPLCFALPRLLLQPAMIQREGARWRYSFANSNTEPNVKPAPSIFQAMASQAETAVNDAVARAARRLKSGGLTVCGYRYRSRQRRLIDTNSAIPGQRLLAAMLFPLCTGDLEAIANQVLYAPESEEEYV